MTENEYWLQQRLTLLQAHLREWEVMADQRVLAQNLLIAEYDNQKSRLHPLDDVVKWASLLAQYNRNTVKLAVEDGQNRKLIKIRHDQERTELEEQIRQAQKRYIGNPFN